MKPSQALTAEIQAERAVFAEAVRDVELSRLIFVDESGVCLGMRQSYGYAPRGQPCVEYAPYRKGRRVSLMGWIGSTRGEVVACEGTVDRAMFERFVVEHLAPSLQAGDVVVWDNHTIHKSAAAREAVEARGARLLAQPRSTTVGGGSPDCNATELLWSKIKRLVRQAAADTVDGLHAAMEQACAMVSASDLEGWIGHTQRLNPHA